MKTTPFRLFFCVILYALTLTSCVSVVKTSDLRPGSNNCIGLPALMPTVDEGSLESVYPSSSVVTTESNVSFMRTSRNPGAQDIITLFEREVKDCITNPYGESKGYIVCSIAGEKVMNLNLISPFLFFVPTLLGVPIARASNTLEVDVEIYSGDNRLIGRYSGGGYNKSYSGLYYGYRISSLSRITGIKAFKMAMDEIKQKIEKDQERLIAELGK
jgi:hypothetical protein